MWKSSAIELRDCGLYSWNMNDKCVVYMCKRLLVELHYTLYIKQTVIILFIYFFTIMPLCNVFSVASCNLTPADIQW